MSILDPQPEEVDPSGGGSGGPHPVDSVDGRTGVVTLDDLYDDAGAAAAAQAAAATDATTKANAAQAAAATDATTKANAAQAAAEAASQPVSADLSAIDTANNGGVLAATTASFTTADETKLDGIASGAQVNDTASQILTKLLTVDGAGSGLDADLLDGLSSADFQQLNADLTDLIARWITATAAGPASLDFPEDTDNGTNRIRVTAPAVVASDKTLTLPDKTGTLIIEADAVKSTGGGQEVIDPTTGNTGSTETLDVANGNVFVRTQDQSCTYTFTNPASATTACSFTLILTGVTGTATWPASVNWPSGTPPTLSGRCLLTFITVNGGTDWDGFLAGSGLA